MCTQLDGTLQMHARLIVTTINKYASVIYSGSLKGSTFKVATIYYVLD